MKVKFKTALAVCGILPLALASGKLMAQGMTFAEALKSATPGKLISVTLVTNQDNGIVAYVTASLEKTGSQSLGAPGPSIGEFLGPANPAALYSDRTSTVCPDCKPGKLAQSYTQPFVYNRPGNWTLSIQQEANGDITATINGTKNKISLQANGDLLYGVGEPVGDKTKQAFYVIAFTGLVDAVEPPK
jgi:hypothetical protein